jgi:hypothetical protein
MDGAGGVCELRLGDPEAPAPQAGEPLRVELDAGDGLRKVFTGTVDTVRIDATGQHVTAYDDLHKLAGLETEASYENVDVDFVIKDVLQRAGVATGRISKGFNLPSYVLTRSPGALRQVLELADWCGADLFGDSEGKAHFVTPAEQGAAHGFEFAMNVLQIEIQATPPIHDSVEVFGEGAAGSQGADKFCWLASDLAGVSGQAAIDPQGAVAVGRTGNDPAPPDTRCRAQRRGSATRGRSADAGAGGTLAARPHRSPRQTRRDARRSSPSRRPFLPDTRPPTCCWDHTPCASARSAMFSVAGVAS